MTGGHRWVTGGDGLTCERCNGLQSTIAARPCPADWSTPMDQYLVDYTVRNITTGDEEEIRVLELEPAEYDGFPETVREEIRGLVAAVGYQPDGGGDMPTWDRNQDRIVELLLPYITHLDIYRADYARWERMVLDDDDILASTPPEDVADAVYDILNTAAGAAIANWAEGFWEHFHPSTTRREVLQNFAGFITAWLETVSDEDDPDLGVPLIVPTPEEQS